MAKTPVTVKFDDDLLEMVKEEIEASDYEPSRSQVIRTAVQEYLEGNASRGQPAATAD